MKIKLLTTFTLSILFLNLAFAGGEGRIGLNEDGLTRTELRIFEGSLGPHKENEEEFQALSKLWGVSPRHVVDQLKKYRAMPFNLKKVTFPKRFSGDYDLGLMEHRECGTFDHRSRHIGIRFQGEECSCQSYALADLVRDHLASIYPYMSTVRISTNWFRKVLYDLKKEERGADYARLLTVIQEKGIFPETDYPLTRDITNQALQDLYENYKSSQEKLTKSFAGRRRRMAICPRQVDLMDQRDESERGALREMVRMEGPTLAKKLRHEGETTPPPPPPRVPKSAPDPFKPYTNSKHYPFLSECLERASDGKEFMYLISLGANWEQRLAGGTDGHQILKDALFGLGHPQQEKLDEKSSIDERLKVFNRASGDGKRSFYIGVNPNELLQDPYDTEDHRHALLVIAVYHHKKKGYFVYLRNSWGVHPEMNGWFPLKSVLKSMKRVVYFQ